MTTNVKCGQCGYVIRVATRTTWVDDGHGGGEWVEAYYEICECGEELEGEA